MKIACRYCGIVNKPHHCPYIRKINRSRADNKVYESKEYRKVRKDVLDDYNHLCLWSLYVDGRVKLAERTHHIIEVLDDISKAVDYDNLIPLTVDAHEYVHSFYKINDKTKKEVQELLRKMCSEYKKGNRELGYFKHSPPISK